MREEREEKRRKSGGSSSSSSLGRNWSALGTALIYNQRRRRQRCRSCSNRQSPDNTVTSSCLSHLFYVFIYFFLLPTSFWGRTQFGRSLIQCTCHNSHGSCSPGTNSQGTLRRRPWLLSSAYFIVVTQTMFRRLVIIKKRNDPNLAKGPNLEREVAIFVESYFVLALSSFFGTHCLKIWRILTLFPQKYGDFCTHIFPN